MIDVKDIDAIIGAEVMDTANDRIGRVSQVYIDSEDQHPSWVSVRTGFFGRSETLIPIDDARWESSTLFVQVDRAKVREAPHVDPDQELSVEEQTALYRYYGKGRTEDAPAPSEQPATEQPVAEQPVAEQPEDDRIPDAADSAPAPVEQPQDAAVAPDDAPAAVEDTAAAPEPVVVPVEQPAAELEQPVAAADAAPAAEIAEPAVEPVVEPVDSTDVAPVADVAPVEAPPVDDGPTDAEAEAEADAEAAEVSAAEVSAVEPEPEPVAAATQPVGDAPAARGARRRSNYVRPDDADPAAADAAPEAGAQPEVITRYEERLRIATERVPATRIKLVKRIVTEHRTVSVPVSHEELHLERETIGEEEIAAWEGPMSELQEEEREIVLMAERPVVSTHTAPIERIRLVREVVSGTHDVEADLRHEQFDLDRGDGADRQV